MPTDPFAMVRPDSSHQTGLLALGWAVTDSQDGWDHMEPPTGAPMLIQREGDGEYVSRLELREGDGVIVTAPDMDHEDLDELREQVCALLGGELDVITANSDIYFQAISRPRTQIGPLDMVVVKAPELSDADIETLREEVATAMRDPDYTLVVSPGVQVEVHPFDPEALKGGWDVVATRPVTGTYRYSTVATMGSRYDEILALGDEGADEHALFKFDFQGLVPAEGDRFRFDVTLTPLPDTALRA